MELRDVQRPLKQRYAAEPEAAQITLTATGAAADAPIACSVDLGRAVYEAQAHAGVGGAGTAACSGDLLLGALAACTQLTAQMVAANLGVTATITASVSGDLDLRGTLGVPGAPVGFTSIRTRFEVAAPGATADQLAALQDKTERYCVVYQTLCAPPAVTTDWAVAG